MGIIIAVGNIFDDDDGDDDVVAEMIASCRDDEKAVTTLLLLDQHKKVKRRPWSCFIVIRLIYYSYSSFLQLASTCSNKL